MEKHTPGPWRTGDLFHTVFGPPNGQPAPEVIATVNRANHKADARLIAKAPELAEALEQMVANLIEAHASEFEDCHAGDADLPGEAPEACSYCKDIAEARELLREAGRDVSAITPEGN